MKVIYGIGNLNKGGRRNKVVAVGVFDGLHQGHRLVLRRTVREARRRHWASAVVTFSRHPVSFLNLKKNIPSIITLEEKLALLKAWGVSIVYILDFDKSFSSFSPRQFIGEVCIRGLHMRSLCVGEDFVFGKRARGGKALLKKFSKEFSFNLRIVRQLKIKNRIVSSTLIRERLRAGRLSEVTRLLGRPFSLSGLVVRGEGRGRWLGFPTANISPEKEIFLPDGVYVAQAHLCSKRLFSLTYVGKRPTFKRRAAKKAIEVFIPGFKGNLYGKKMKLSFLKMLRRDKKFDTAFSLSAQILQDMETARSSLSKIPAGFHSL